MLYIIASAGKVQRYDPASGNLLAAWTVGTKLNGADLTSDAASL